MTLGQQQRLFTRLIGQLIQYAYANGYELTFGDAYRDPRAFGDFGVKRLYSAAYSVHKVKLAVDFNLFKKGVFLTDSNAHRELGEYWESLHELCRWGGRWNDGNHYSMEYQGKK